MMKTTVILMVMVTMRMMKHDDADDCVIAS